MSAKKKTAVAAAADLALGDNIVVSGKTVTQVIEAIRMDSAATKKWVAAADLLFADGVTVDYMEKHDDARDKFKKGVVYMSFTPTERGIYERPVHSLTDEQRVTRRWVQTEMGSRYGKVMRYLARREIEETLTDDERGARKVASMGSRLKKALGDWITKIEKAEKVDFSAVEMIKALKAAQALIK